MLLAGAVALVSVLAGSGGPWPVLQPAYAGYGRRRTGDAGEAVSSPRNRSCRAPRWGTCRGSGSRHRKAGYTYTLLLEVWAGRRRDAAEPGIELRQRRQRGVGRGAGSLSGLSSITRCGQTLSTQGYVGGVHMTDFPADPAAGVPEDSFCLDGQTLVAINR